ncbi:hypothetical protein DCS_07731 [Drechmeria coniospora]|uniref:Myb-like DNA-binding domain-containing protein n=1 Tax=Drechmeria coniospora TaxID=98403 RepID=A0A151GF91_DRECN|nr:hypothetical protein DCS_07731 [Drechmeria coniospora]KYK55767.1 hypothetical protein DCS_07731 [Drechmeria coniospora]ODA81634.1 hypothetical protein RJ55_00135 [Drechmeria coniospora]
MSKENNSEQVRFLVTCIKHTNQGRPNFELVAEELDIVTKAAAQKRYERLLKAHGVTATSQKATAKAIENEQDAITPLSTPAKRKAPRANTGGVKKPRNTSARNKKEILSYDAVIKVEDAKAIVKSEAEEDSALSEPPVSDAEIEI